MDDKDRGIRTFRCRCGSQGEQTLLPKDSEAYFEGKGRVDTEVFECRSGHYYWEVLDPLTECDCARSDGCDSLDNDSILENKIVK